MIWILNFPLPPSVNEYLIPVVSNKYAIDRRGKPYQKAHFMKSKSHTDFFKRCQEWRAYHNNSFGKIQTQLLEMQRLARTKGTPFALRVDHYFVFHHARIWTVNNLPEQLDADNLVKPTRDALAKLLEIDDKHFFSGYFEKVTTHSKDLECSIHRISQMTPKTLEDVKTLVRTETMVSS